MTTFTLILGGLFLFLVGILVGWYLLGLYIGMKISQWPTAEKFGEAMKQMKLRVDRKDPFL